MISQRKRLTYLSYYLLLSCVFVLFVAIPVRADFILAIESKIHILTNQEREKSGLPPLSSESRLAGMARQHSEEMATLNYFDHTSPVEGYETLRDRAEKSGVTQWKALGENIAYLSGYSKGDIAEKVMQGWMNSEGHKENILDESFTHLGVGVYEQDGKYYVTQNFAAFHSIPSSSSSEMNAIPQYSNLYSPYRTSFNAGYPFMSSIGYPFTSAIPYSGSYTGMNLPYSGLLYGGSLPTRYNIPFYNTYIGMNLPYGQSFYSASPLFGSSMPYYGIFTETHYPYSILPYSGSPLFGSNIPYYGSFIGTELPFSLLYPWWNTR